MMAAAFAQAVVKHLPGQHDQSTHGRRGRTRVDALGPSLTVGALRPRHKPVAPVPTEAPPFAKDVPRFRTKDEAYHWLAKNVGVRAISDDRLTLEELQQLADGCYPAVRDFRTQIGTMEIQTAAGTGRRSAAFREDGVLLLSERYRKNEARRDAEYVENFRLHKEAVLRDLEEKLRVTPGSSKVKSDMEAMKACSRWSASTGASHPIETVYAHEMGHRVLGRGDDYWAWELALTRNGVTRRDEWAVSEYGATTNGGELFAEVHAMVVTGRESELPASVADAYQDWFAATHQRTKER